eukprot:COSAG06_NODE_16662_length_988_cov_0.975253_2_plen_69_part_00
MRADLRESMMEMQSLVNCPCSSLCPAARSGNIVPLSLADSPARRAVLKKRVLLKGEATRRGRAADRHR